MSTTATAEVSSIASRTIEAERFERAVTEDMAVEWTADRLYHVTTETDEYDVDLESGACSCPDHEYRGEQYLCKHLCRAALVETFANTVSTELVARVVRFAREHHCPFSYSQLCDGPVGPRLPCCGCIDAVRSETVDEWTVWACAVTEARS